MSTPTELKTGCEDVEQTIVDKNNSSATVKVANGADIAVGGINSETKSIVVEAIPQKMENPSSNKDEINNDTADEILEAPNVSSNPDLPDDDENKDMLNRLRGDAIGSTMYSERFVISILLKLRAIKEPLEKNEKLERELESLWDMTIEYDVVIMLLRFDVFDVFTQCIINYSNDVRLIEILIGIIGNMCSVGGQAMQQLSKNELVMQIILQLINSSDSCILIQLMRLLATVYTTKQSAIAWNQQIKAVGNDFIDGFAFILNSSNNSSLLSHALVTLNTILDKCADLKESQTDETDSASEHRSLDDNEEASQNFLDFFVCESLISSSIEAFRTLHSKETANAESLEDEEFSFSESISEVFKKTIIVFLNIHDIFLNFTSVSYDNCEQGLETCLDIILSTIATKNMVLYSNIEFMLNFLECIGEIYLARPRLHSEDHTFYVIKIWELITKQVIVFEQTNGTSNANDFENDNFENEHLEEFNDRRHLTEELLRMLLQRCDVEAYENIFRRCIPEVAQKILELYGVEITDYDETNMSAYCAELKAALNGVKDET